MSEHTSFMRYDATARWFGRAESTSALGARLARFVDRLTELHPVQRGWQAGVPIVTFEDYLRTVPYADIRDDLAGYIEWRIKRADNGSIERYTGYSVVLTIADEPSLLGFQGAIGSVVGPTAAGPMSNYIDLSIGGFQPLDPEVVPLSLVRGIVHALIECWEPKTCFVGPLFGPVSLEREGDGVFDRAWITYLAPEDAANVDLAGVPIVEGAPGGGLILWATHELFDPSNETHVAGAAAIAAATRPLNAQFPPRARPPRAADAPRA